jgi:hypothetical protein
MGTGCGASGDAEGASPSRDSVPETVEGILFAEL